MSYQGKPKPLVSGPRPDRRVIVGSGIKSIAHLTLEAVGHLKAANKVFYTVADGLPRAFTHGQDLTKRTKPAHFLQLLRPAGRVLNFHRRGQHLWEGQYLDQVCNEPHRRHRRHADRTHEHRALQGESGERRGTQSMSTI